MRYLIGGLLGGLGGLLGGVSCLAVGLTSPWAGFLVGGLGGVVILNLAQRLGYLDWLS
jgi:hypothetical protein